MTKFLILPFFTLSLLAVSPVVTSKRVYFKHVPDPADLGGLSTNDYYTNIVFELRSVTNCTIPTNQWPVVTNWLASTFQSTDGNWTNSVTIDGSTRFYLLSAKVIGGGSSPFSNLDVSVADPPPGIMQGVGP